MEKYVVRCKTTGKYLRKADRAGRQAKPTKYTGTSIDKARVFSTKGHIKQAIGVRKTGHALDFRRYCRRCKVERDIIGWDYCPICGERLFTGSEVTTTIVIPDNVEIITLTMKEVI